MIRWLWALGMGGTAVLLFLPLPQPFPQLLAFLLLAIWPATTWLLCQSGPPLERLLTATAVPLLLNSLLVLLLHYWPGPISQTALVTGALWVAWWPLWHTRKRALTLAWPVLPSLSQSQMVLTAVLVIIVCLRFVNLGYSEFQGDEGVIMVRAAAMITGDDSELFLHQKGPLEILLPLALWQMAGQINEFWARLPFAWGGVLAILAVLALARRWFGLDTALLAALLLALNGFSLAFGRIVQYQSFVMLWGALALLYATRYSAEGKRSDLWGTAVFLAAGLLAHYDAVLVLPAMGWLLLKRVRRERPAAASGSPAAASGSPAAASGSPFAWRDWLTAVALGGLTLALFYLPFVLDANFARTGQYLVQGRLGVSDESGWFRWSGAQVWQMVTFYNSLYYVVGLALLVLLGLAVLAKRRAGAAAILYFVTPFLFYLFIVGDPRTHVYTFFPGAVIVAAVGAVAVGQWLAARRLRPLGAALLTLFVLVTAVYLWLIFIDHSPERQRTWAENRPRFYPTTWAEPPLYGIFGFPHQAGWRRAAELVPPLPYASNEEPEITDWYMAQAARSQCANFASFVQAARVQDVVPFDAAELAGLPVQGKVTVAGREGLVVYGRVPTPNSTTLEASGYTLWRTPEEVAPPTSGGTVSANMTLGNEQVRLLGYDLDTSQATPGGRVTVTLYWQALAPFDQNYQVFTHLVDGQLRTQHDGAPNCALKPTTSWEPGQIISDPHLIQLPSDMPVGEIPLLVGMYNLLTSERLPQTDTGTDALYLTDILIR